MITAIVSADQAGSSEAATAVRAMSSTNYEPVKARQTSAARLRGKTTPPTAIGRRRTTRT
jgi:hypothetical protein